MGDANEGRRVLLVRAAGRGLTGGRDTGAQEPDDPVDIPPRPRRVGAGLIVVHGGLSNGIVGLEQKLETEGEGALRQAGRFRDIGGEAPSLAAPVARHDSTGGGSGDARQDCGELFGRAARELLVRADSGAVEPPGGHRPNARDLRQVVARVLGARVLRGRLGGIRTPSRRAPVDCFGRPGAARRARLS